MCCSHCLKHFICIWLEMFHLYPHFKSKEATATTKRKRFHWVYTSPQLLGRGIACLALFRKLKTCPKFWGRSWFRPSLGEVFQSKCSFTRPFFLEILTKCLSKCPNSRKPPLLWKISGCTPDMSRGHFNPSYYRSYRNDKYHGSIKTMQWITTTYFVWQMTLASYGIDVRLICWHHQPPLHK